MVFIETCCGYSHNIYGDDARLHETIWPILLVYLWNEVSYGTYAHMLKNCG